MVEVMKMVSEGYGMNKVVAEKKFGKGAVVLDIRECGMMGFLSPMSEWKELKIPGSEKEVLSMIGAYEGLKVFGRKGIDESFFVNRKKIIKGRNVKSYGDLKGFKWKDEKVEYDMGVKCFREWYMDEVKGRWKNMIKMLGETSNDKNIILLYDEDRNWLDYAGLLKRMISEAAG